MPGQAPKKSYLKKNKTKLTKYKLPGTGELAQWLGAHTALPEDLRLLLSTHVNCLTANTFRVWGLLIFLDTFCVTNVKALLQSLFPAITYIMGKSKTGDILDTGLST